ncbi:hypothetical protein ACHAXT_008769 [Thalassiosira profunda]
MPHTTQQRPAVQTRRDETAHPSAGGRGDGYDPHFRSFVMAVRQAGQSDDPIFQQLRALHLYPSERTELRWEDLQASLGHVRQCRRTGNKRATVLRDHNQLLVALYRIAYPKATAAEVNAFLFRANFGNLNFRFYSASQISECESRIGFTRKRGSTTAYQALLPRNKQKRWCFWNLPYPYGIADIRRRDLIDLDECGIELQSADRHIGKAYIGKRVQQTGPYQKSTKWNLLLAICGDGNTNHRWRDIWTGEGTTGERMCRFIRQIINSIGPGTPARRYCFIMDNLSSHHHLQMAAIIFAAGHRLAFRAPYYPVDGPIEYVFNTIQGVLRIRMDLIVDGPSLIAELNQAITGIPSFEPYFVNCGFIRP